MGQNDVMEVLKKNKGWMIVGEIADIIGANRGNVSRSLRILFKDDCVMKKQIPTRRRGNSYLWKYKD